MMPLLRDDPARVLGAEAHRRLDRHGAARASMPSASLERQLRSRHRRRGASSARPLEPELEARRRAQQALPAAAVGDAGAERPDRALQPADAAEARHLQDAEGVPHRLHDAGQAAPAGQSRAPARADARRHDPQHARRRRAEAAAPPRHHHQGRRRAGRGRGLRRSGRRRRARLRRRRTTAGASGFALHHLLAAAGSSPAAAAAAVGRHRRARSAGRQAWARARQTAGRRIGTGGKEAALLELLRRNPDEKKLVFVHSRETLDHLADRLDEAGIALRALRRQPERAGEGRGHRRVPRPASVLLCTQSGGEGRNIQFCNTLDQFRRAVEPDGDRAAHRPHRPHRPEPRGVRVQPRHPRHARGAGAGAARREDLDVRAGGRRGRRHPRRPRGGARVPGSGARCLAGGDRGRPRDGVRGARRGSSNRRAQQHEGAKALDEKLFGEDFEAA